MENFYPTSNNINYRAIKHEDAAFYLKYRYKQLASYGIYIQKEIWEEGAIISIYSSDNTKPKVWGYSKNISNINFGSIYILHNYRSKGLYKKIFDRYSKYPKEYSFNQIITMRDCNITDFLSRNDIPYKVAPLHPAYAKIEMNLELKYAKKSGIPHIYHIIEGLTVLNHLDSGLSTRNAWCLHPLYQSNLEEAREQTQEYFSSKICSLATEYALTANSYLSTGSRDKFIGLYSEECREMLIADKVQNYKDFILHIKGFADNSERLEEYFEDWFDILEIRPDEYLNLMI